MLESIERRHTDERAFQTALTDWQIATTNPEMHKHWQQLYANALRDALRKANNRRKETLGQMTQDDWCWVVTQEMQADRWYAKPAPDGGSLMLHISGESKLLPGWNGNGYTPKVNVAAE